ncbi:MAG: hypothetical protein IT572_03105 [Deltaproteobacteria bacterium]|nr:hypothetical protein [Deltaproteobacteria bacterium]
MPASLTLQSHLCEVDEELRLYVLRLEESIQAAGDFSLETLSRFKERMSERIQEWQGITQKAREALGGLPREVRHRGFARDFRAALENGERSVRHWYGQISIFFSTEGPSGLAGAREELVGCLEKIRSAAKQLASPLQTLRSHPLVLRFLEGQGVLASRTQLQWSRKAFHTLSGLFGLWLYGYSGLDESVVTLILATCFSGAALTEIVRRAFPSANQKICEKLRLIMRERERAKISSATWFMGAMLAVFLIFPKPAGILALYYTSVGDTAAGIVGSRWGRHKLGAHVSVEGCLAAFTVCLVGTLLFASYGLPSFHPRGWELWVFSLIAASVATVAEATIKKLDDNLVIPLVSATAVWLLMRAFS